MTELASSGRYMIRFNCCNCNTGFFDTEHEFVKNDRINTDVKIPRGWTKVESNGGIGFVCPKCQDNDRLRNKQIALKSMIDSVINDPYSEVELINIKMNASEIIKVCNAKLKMEVEE